MVGKEFWFAGSEWKNISASKIMWVAIAAVAVIPLLYGALYLAAFEDPYENLNTVPVAVVNEDDGALIAGEQRKLGDEIVEQLKDNDEGLQWNFVSAEQAREGLANGSYFMSCTIPSDFSESLASADTDAPRRGQMSIVYNQSENLLASQIGGTVWDEVRQTVSDQVSKEYWTNVFSRLSDSAVDMGSAADGAASLNEGLLDAYTGSGLIADNIKTLQTGAGTLYAGLNTLSAGTSSLADGANTLGSGLQTLSGGLINASDGAQALADGAGTLQEGTSSLALGAASLAQAAQSMPSSEQIDQLTEGSQAISQGFENVQAGIGSPDDTSSLSLYGGVNTLVAGIGESGDSYPSQQTVLALMNSSNAAY